MAGASEMRSYKLTQFGAPLSEVIESPPAPKGTQVLLRVSACGVCHSDLHVADGYFDLGNGQKLDLAQAVKLPRILGHEIAGVVEEPRAGRDWREGRRPPCDLCLGRMRTLRAVPGRRRESVRQAAKPQHPC
jgi:D-arabinose 1-dehydrogenase-like Zn-dependent alcohol dehydrogenase